MHAQDPFLWEGSSPKSHFILVGLAPQQIFLMGGKVGRFVTPKSHFIFVRLSHKQIILTGGLLWEGYSPKSHLILVRLTPEQTFVELTPFEPA